MSQLRFAVPFGVASVCVLAVIAVLLIALGYRELQSVEPPARRRGLFLLRVLSALMALLCAAQPQWIVQRVEELPGRIAVLLDSSRSMLIRDGSQDRLSRAVQAVQQFYDGARDKPALFSFGQDVAPLTRTQLDGKQLGFIA